jgi:hypothetical protein
LHFDDKIAQKYLLEAVEAPLAPSYVFFHKEDALGWISQATFPKGGRFCQYQFLPTPC